jgi:hypothetical protein
MAAVVGYNFRLLVAWLAALPRLFIALIVGCRDATVMPNPA